MPQPFVGAGGGARVRPCPSWTVRGQASAARSQRSVARRRSIARRFTRVESHRRARAFVARRWARFSAMGLSMVVGILADADADDDEYIEAVRADFVVIRELLHRAGALQWSEPEVSEADATEFEMWGYSGLPHGVAPRRPPEETSGPSTCPGGRASVTGTGVIPPRFGHCWTPAPTRRRGMGHRKPPHSAAERGLRRWSTELADIDAEEQGHPALWAVVYHRCSDNARALAAAGAEPWRSVPEGWSPGRLSLAVPTRRSGAPSPTGSTSTARAATMGAPSGTAPPRAEPCNPGAIRPGRPTRSSSATSRKATAPIRAHVHLTPAQSWTRPICG